MSEFGNKWSSAATAKFIELLKEQPILWDPKHPGRFDRAKRKKGYQEMHRQIKKALPEIEFTILDLEKKNKTLRTQYKKEILLLQTKKRNRPMLWCFDMLDFLQKVYGLTEVKTASNLTASELIKKRSNWFPRKTLIKLIRELKKYPLLWDREHAFFNDKTLRAEKYHTMWLMLHKDFTLDEIKNKVKYFRRQFDLQYRKIKAYKDKGINITPTLWCYKELWFLCPADELKPNDAASEQLSQLSDRSELTSEETAKNDDAEFELDSLEFDTNEGKEMKNAEFAEELTSERDSNTVDPFECVQLSAEERFKWLGNKLVQTLNKLHDEHVILNSIKEVQKLLTSAVSVDSLILPVERASTLKFQEKQKTDDKQSSSFHITLAFNADDVNLNHLMAKISQLPALKKLEFTGNSLKKIIPS